MRMDYRSIALKSDAARYDVAIRTIAGVTSMRLENPQELKAALVILSEQFTYLKLHRSKLITLVLSDNTFTSALKEACPNQEAAKSLMRELRAYPKAVFKLKGAHVLSVRLMESVRADVTNLRRTAQRLREAIALSNGSREIGWCVQKSNPYYDPTDYNPFFYDSSVFARALIITALVMIAGELAFSTWVSPYSVDVERCQYAALTKYVQCNATAMTYPQPEREKRSALCTAAAYEQVAECFAPSRTRRQLPWDDLPTLK